MKLETWLKQATKKLNDAGVGTARLDCLVFLEDCLNTNRTHLLARPELELSIEQINVLDRCISRRANHEPLAYIRGRTEFYGREFMVTRHVLEPRPESETMIDLLKSIGLPPMSHIVDVGAGSGALGITAKLELPAMQVDLLELDTDALAVAQKNVNKFNIQIACVQSNLLSRAPSRYDAVLANMPYVPNNFQINQAAQAEPPLAIFGGADGLDIYRRLFAELSQFDWRPSYIFTESLPLQHEKLSRIARKAGFKLTRTEDFIQQFEPIG